MSNQQTVIYSSRSLYKKGLLMLIKMMFGNIFRYRELIWQLFTRDFKARYKQSLLGWLWIFFMPLITMGTFLLLNISGIIQIGKIPVPYPIFGLLGFSLWQIFANGLIVLTVSVAAGESLITQINFPKEVLVFSSISQVIIDFFIRIVMVLIVYLIYGLTPSWLIIFFPIYVLPIFLLTLGIGFFTAFLHVIIRDTREFINLGVSFLIFLMPIMYTMPAKGFLARINLYNPLYYLIDTPRQIIISGQIPNLQIYLLMIIFSITIFLSGWFCFFISQNKLAERL